MVGRLAHYIDVPQTAFLFSPLGGCVMPITLKKSHGPAYAQAEHSPRQRGHVIPRKPLIDLNGPGRLRSAHVLALLGVSHSTMYERLKAGDGSFPIPDGKDGGSAAWQCREL